MIKKRIDQHINRLIGGSSQYEMHIFTLCKTVHFCRCEWNVNKKLTWIQIMWMKKCNILTFDPAVDRGWVEFGANATLKGSRRVSNNYITRCHSWSQLVGVRVAVWSSENQPPAEGLGPQAPGWAAQQMRKKCCYSQRNLGSICCSLFSLLLTSHNNPFASLSQPFRIKCERYIFLKECVRSSLLLILFPRIYVYVSRLDNKNTVNKK